MSRRQKAVFLKGVKTIIVDRSPMGYVDGISILNQTKEN